MALTNAERLARRLQYIDSLTPVEYIADLEDQIRLLKERIRQLAKENIQLTSQSTKDKVA